MIHADEIDRPVFRLGPLERDEARKHAAADGHGLRATRGVPELAARVTPEMLDFMAAAHVEAWQQGISIEAWYAAARKGLER